MDLYSLISVLPTRRIIIMVNTKERDLVDSISRTTKILQNLNKDMNQVRDLIKEKKYQEACKTCSDLLVTLPGNFVNRYRSIITRMIDMTEEEFNECMSRPFKVYPYSQKIERTETPPKLPAIIATEHYDVIEYIPINNSENHKVN